jgi:tellurite resistance protein
MFGKLKDLVSGGGKKLSGKTDLLEGIAAGSILIAAADGEMDTAEVAVIIENLQNYDKIAEAFTPSQIENVVNDMIKKASPNAAGKIGLVGKMKLEKEVSEVRSKSSNDDLQMMLAILADVAGADDDGIEPAEKATINKISRSLGQGDFL